MTLWKEILSVKSGPKELRKFGITMGVCFFIVSLILLWRHREFFIYAFAVSVLFALGAIMAPAVLKPIQKVWMALALVMGWVMTRVLLAVVFYLVLTPIGIMMSLSGKDPLSLKPKQVRGSVWTDHARRAKESYEKQF